MWLIVAGLDPPWWQGGNGAPCHAVGQASCVPRAEHARAYFEAAVVSSVGNLKKLPEQALLEVASVAAEESMNKQLRTSGERRKLMASNGLDDRGTL
eukprot:2127263-Amphidinium_carterae.1